MKNTINFLVLLLIVSHTSPMPMPQVESPTFPVNTEYTSNVVVGLSIITFLLCSLYMYKKYGDFHTLTQEEECEKEVK